jgi:hypothetical protein
MDDYKIWFYLILGIIYILSRALKKPKRPTGSTPEQTYSKNSSPAPKEEPLSFEELLREITEGKTKTKPPKPKPAPTPQYVDYDDDIPEEEQDLEDVNYDYRNEDKIYETYEKAKKQAFERPSLEETLESREGMKFEKFKEFEDEEKNTVLSEYSEAFNDPEGVKKAFVLSEIFNRKYT